jgi:hypothetical protein
MRIQFQFGGWESLNVISSSREIALPLSLSGTWKNLLGKIGYFWTSSEFEFHT